MNEKFKITYHPGYGYKVSIPNYEGGEVVQAVVYEALKASLAEKEEEIKDYREIAIRRSGSEDDAEHNASVIDAEVRKRLNEEKAEIRPSVIVDGLVYHPNEIKNIIRKALEDESEIDALKEKLAALENQNRLLMDDNAKLRILIEDTEQRETKMKKKAEGLSVFIERVAQDGCGCRPVCKCYTESHLRIWKHEVQGEARDTLAAFRKELPQDGSSLDSREE